MLIPPVVWDALLDAGAQLVPGVADSADLLIRSADGVALAAEVKVSRHGRPLTPSDIRELADSRPETPLLLIVPTATAAARAAAAAIGWSLIALNPKSRTGPDGEIRLSPSHTIAIGPVATSDHGSERRPGPVAWGTITLLRRLLENPGATQAELAELAGVSQPRVSQALKPLVKDGLIHRVSTGSRPRWIASNWDALVNRWLETYPGAGGISTYWYGLDTPTEQAATVIAYFTKLAERGPSQRPPMTVGETVAVARGQRSIHEAVVSGDVAADHIAPWRRPRRAVIYARRGADLSKTGLVPAGEDEATLELVVPKDPGVWPIGESVASGRSARPLPMADPLQVLWDLRRTPGPDSDQASDRFLAVLRSHARKTAHGEVSDTAQDLWTDLLRAAREEPSP